MRVLFPTFVFCSDGSRGAVPQALLCSSETLPLFLFDGQQHHKHKHAGTGAGRQEYAATHSTGRLDQEPRPTRQNCRTKVRLNEGRPPHREVPFHLILTWMSVRAVWYTQPRSEAMICCFVYIPSRHGLSILVFGGEETGNGEID